MSVNDRVTMTVQCDIGWSAQWYIGCVVCYTEALVFLFGISIVSPFRRTAVSGVEKGRPKSC